MNVASRNAELMRIAIRVIKSRRVWKEHNSGPCNRRTKAKNRIRDRQYALTVMADMTDFEFQRMFRLSRAGFAKLLEKIRPDIRQCIRR